MKRTIYLLAALCIAMTFTSCVKNEYYTTDPNNNGGGGGNNNNYYVFNEEFSNDNRGWAFSSSMDSAYASVSQGMLEFINYSVVGTNTQVVQTNMRTDGNFTIESRIKSDNEMGLIFGNSGDQYEYGYSFVVNHTGFFIVYKEGNYNTNIQILKNATNSNAININNAWNTLRIEQANGYWTFFINDYEVHQMAARPLNGTYCGYILLPQTQGYADYLTVEW